MIGKYAQRRIYDAINRLLPVYCFIAVAFATFFLGFITNSVISRWWYIVKENDNGCPSFSAAMAPWWTESYIGKTRNIDISRYFLQEPMDVVYTWVNGSDPQFLRDLESYLSQSGSNSEEKKRGNECKLENCIPYAALVFEETLSQRLIDCLKNKDDGQLVDEENDNIFFLAFPKVKNETQCLIDNSRNSIKAKPGCITSSTLQTISAAHPFAFYLVPATRLGNFKDENSLRSLLPSSIGNHITDLKVDIDSDFAILFFPSETQREEAEKDLQVHFGVRTDYPSIVPAFIVDCEEFLASNAFRLEAKPKRFVDNDELRFSLRSLDQFAPWVRHVYLVTNGQIPNWLNLDNPHLTLVTHREIFGERAEQVLPTFSSPAIESQLVNIPGISKQFIYFNDDFFLGQPIYPEDFSTHSTGRKFYMTYSLPNCAPGCPHTWIRDGYCDRTCNNSDCDFDGGDCEMGVNSTTLPIPVHPLDMEYALERAYCSNGCSNAWIADGFCDGFCNVPSCAFDAGDCGLLALLNPLYGFFTFNIENSRTAVIKVPKQEFIVIGNLSSVVPPGKQFKIGKCSTPVTPALRTSSFIASHSLFVLIAYRNISNSNFTAECELTFAGSINVNFAISFDTFIPPVVPPTVNSTPLDGIPPSVPFSEEILSPKIVKIEANRSLFDRFPPNKRHFVIRTCLRFIPLVRRHIFRFKNGELTKLGLGVFLENLLTLNSSCEKVNLDIHVEEGEVIAQPMLVAANTTVPSLSSFQPPRNKRRMPGLNRKQQASSIILSRFRPRSPNLANPNSTANQEQLAPDAFSGSLQYVNKLLNRDFGYAQRRMPAHAPLLIERKVFLEMYDRYEQEWLATSSRRFRSHEDMQLQFSYMYYVMSTTLNDSSDRDEVIERIFDEEIDLDQSGDLSVGEMRTLIVRAKGSAYSLQSWRRFGNSMVQNGCFENLTEFLSVFSDGQDSSSRRLTVSDAKNCLPLRELFNLIAKLRSKYKFEALIADDDSAVFRMLQPNYGLLIESWLNLLRRRPPKFFCLNDDLDHSEPLKPDTERVLNQVKQFLSETYPRRSQFELPPSFRNVFQSVDDYRRFRNESLRQKAITFYALMFVTALLLLMCIYRWGRFLQRPWRWFWSRPMSSSTVVCGLSED